MDKLYQRYCDNLTAAFALIKPQITQEMTDGQIVSAIRDSAEGIFRIHQENDRLLEELLFSRTPESLSEGEAGQLEELARALFNFNRSPDTGIAHRIHKLLYAYAKLRGDEGRMIKELYWQGVTLLYMNVHRSGGEDLFTEQVGEYFRAGAAYMDRYGEFRDPETRGYIIRCLGNMKFGLKSGAETDGTPALEGDWTQYMAIFSRTMEILCSPRYRELDPEIPWERFVYTMHYDRTKFLSTLRRSENEEIARAVLESAEYVYRHQEVNSQAQEKNTGVRTRYVYAAARYHAGAAPLEELVETLFRIGEEADIHSFTGDNIWAILNGPEYLIHYCGKLPPARQREVEARLRQAVDRQREFLFLLPKNEYAPQVSQAVQAISLCVTPEDQNFSRRILTYMLACHPPTFVHSKMVALLARHVCERLAQTNAAALDGTFDFARASEHLEEILERTYEAGLYHDLGKCMILESVGRYSRRLLDEEFACIKLHPRFGCELLRNLGMRDSSDVAYYHHCSYDGAGGYPSRPGQSPARVRRIVDIITVVDSLDAGTDDVGRSYAAAKRYAQLVEELRAGKGKRYAPEVVELFDDGEFYRETEEMIRESRIQTYLDAYRKKE